MRKYEIKRTEKKSEEPKVRATMNVPTVKADVKETKKAEVKVEAPAKSEITATDDDLLAELQAIVVLIAATNDKLTTLLKIKGVT